MAIAIKPTAKITGNQAEEFHKIIKNNPRKHSDSLDFQVNEDKILDRLKKN